MDSPAHAPTVSVLIGTRNRPRALAACIASIQVQGFEDFEVVVLDDHSDRVDLAETVRAANDGRIRLIRSERQLGVAGGRNLLMRQARGRYLVVIDDDAVFLDPSCVATLVRDLDDNPGVGIVATHVVEPRGATAALLVPFTKAARRRDPGIVTRKQLVSYYVGTCHAMRKSAVETLGYYQDDLVYGAEESDLSYRAALRGIDILFEPAARVEHRPERPVIDGSAGRRRGEVYYNIRNRIWLAYRYLPFPHIVSYIAVWSAYYAIAGLRGGHTLSYLRGWAGGWLGLRRLRRTPLGPRETAALRQRHGRLWY